MRTTTPTPASIGAAFLELVVTLIILTRESFADDDVNSFAVDPKSCRAIDPNQNDEAKAYAAAWTSLDQSVVELATAAARHLETVAAMPASPFAAASQCAMFQVDYENAAAAYLDALERWRALDVQTGRVRAGVIERLMYPKGKPNPEALDNVSPVMSQTAADKAASGDPEYTEHKDQTAAASAEKDAAELTMNVGLQKVMTARELLRTLVVINAAEQSRPLVVMPGGAGKETPPA